MDLLTEYPLYVILSLFMAVAVLLDVNTYMRQEAPWQSYVAAFWWNITLFVPAMALWPIALILCGAGWLRRTWRDVDFT